MNTPSITASIEPTPTESPPKVVHVNEQRLLELYYQGQHRELWYHDARSEIIELSLKVSRPVDEVANLLALYSPRCSVVRSVRHVMRQMHYLPYAPDVTRSTRSAIYHWRITGEIRGPKTSAFAAALKGREQAVVLDVWMAKAMGVDQRLFKGRTYDKMSEYIIRLADQVGTTPARCQAAIWHSTTTNAGVKPGVITLMDEYNNPSRWRNDAESEQVQTS